MEWLQDNPKVRLKDAARVDQKIRKLIQDGPSKVQLVADFDRTLARTHHNGRPVATSYCVFEDDEKVSQEYQMLADQLKRKYLPIELDHSLTEEEKTPHMVNWYKESFAIILNSGVHVDLVPEMVQRADLHLRCRTPEYFDFLKKQGIPVLVFSAGLGNIIELSLKQQDAMKENVTVIANYLEYDSCGMPSKFASDVVLHMYNKNAQFPMSMDYYSRDDIMKRSNAVLLGDSIGDSKMVDGAPCIKLPPDGDSTVIRIGYLNQNFEVSLNRYLDTFDIVLLDDQTMDVPMELFKRICSTSC